ncbi:MAG: aldose 1-epimerase [Sphingobacteriia bacterium]|nr:aldose 1-epimerase [Sphingobacteriia bacterium]
MRFAVSVNQQQAHPVITLKDKQGGCRAEIFAFGGLLNAFHIPLKGKMVNCIEGFSSVADARKNIANSFRSAKISPFVCRMRNGTYQLQNKTYRVHKHYLGEHAIHGLVYDARFTVEKEQATDEFASVLLKFNYTQTDQGYPFAYTLSLLWKLEKGNRISVITSIRHSNNQSIPYADGWHPYFTLGGKVDNYTLQFNGDTQLIFDKELLPTGKKKKDTRFLKGLPLKGVVLDNSFEYLPGQSRRAVLKSRYLQLVVEPDEHYPILQVYTPLSRKSIAIENLSGAPDNFNNGIGLVMLEPNKTHSFSTSYTVTTL